MVHKSDDLWAAGKPEPPYKQKLLDYLKENSHTYFNPMELAEVVFDLSPVEEQGENVETEFEDQAVLNDRMRRSLFAEIMLEDLVEQGLVEKRSIRMSDQIDVMRENNPEIFEKAAEEVKKQFPDETPDDPMYMEVGGDSRTTWYRIKEEAV